MKKRFRHVAGLLLLLVSAGSTLSACQPRPMTVIPSATPAPTGIPPTATPIPSAAPRPTATAQRTSNPNIQARWTFQTGAAVWGTPTISAGTIYLGSDDRNLYAIEAQTGQLKWKFTTQGLVRSRPAIAAGLVYFASDDGYLYAVDAGTGKQTWRVDIGNATELEKREHLGSSPDPSGYDYLQSSPALADGQVYVGSADGKVYALAANSGEINWAFETGDRVRATPTVDNGTVYVGSWDKSVYALDALTGQLRWKSPIGGQVQTTALVANGLVYCASRKASVVALEVQTGEIKWEFSYGHNMWVESSPSLANGVIYIGSSGNMKIYALDSQTGALRGYFDARAFSWSTPAIVHETLVTGCTNYRSTEDNGLLGLEIVPAKPGEKLLTLAEKWRFPIEETLEAGGDWSGVASSLIVVDGVIYFGGLDGRLYALTLPH